MAAMTPHSLFVVGQGTSVVHADDDNEDLDNDSADHTPPVKDNEASVEDDSVSSSVEQEQQVLEELDLDLDMEMEEDLDMALELAVNGLTPKRRAAAESATGTMKPPPPHRTLLSLLQQEMDDEEWETGGGMAMIASTSDIELPPETATAQQQPQDEEQDGEPELEKTGLTLALHHLGQLHHVGQLTADESTVAAHMLRHDPQKLAVFLLLHHEKHRLVWLRNQLPTIQVKAKATSAPSAPSAPQ